MERNTTQHGRKLEVIAHIIGWALVFASPLLYIDWNNPGFGWVNFCRHSVVAVGFVVAFYVNYYYLIPVYLFKDRLKRYAVTNAALIIVITILIYIWKISFIEPTHMGMPVPDGLRERPPRWLFSLRDAFGTTFFIALSAVMLISKKWNNLETARRDAERSRTEAELKNLRNQLNPHFLLNTLNNIYALISFDTPKAQQAVQELSKLLRYMLYDNQLSFVSLGKEADFIRNYIELMRIRLSANVSLETEINIESDSSTLIAPLIFISLIENAFKHGISPTEPSHIHIRLSEKEDRVVCDIINSNFPKSYKDKSGSGIGLAQVCKRLNLLYPGSHTWTQGLSENGKEYISHLEIKV